jgi:hypothetical protein
MGKITEFRIIYETQTGVFMPDQTVHGTVIIDANEPIKARNVTLQVVGQAHTHWKCKHMAT